jgi:hypothetical protein
MPSPCASCGAENSACGAIQITGGDGTTSASGKIDLASGMEPRPCLHCVSFEKDEPKLIRHLLRHCKLAPDENGVFTTPIAKDFPGRRSMQIDPKSHGWCRRDTIVVDMLATCSNWKGVRTISEFASRIKPS